MPQSSTCVKCGSADIVLGARVLEQLGHDIRLRVDADPGALLLKGPALCPLEARVCGQCGYTECYATDPAALLAAWRRSQESSKG
jgi:hypothetical protein